MAELAGVLREFPDLNSWRPDPDRPGLYLHLVRKPFRGAKNAFPRTVDGSLPAPVLEAPSYVEDDFSVRRGVLRPRRLARPSVRGQGGTDAGGGEA